MKLYVCKRCNRWGAVEMSEALVVASEYHLMLSADEPPRCLMCPGEPVMVEGAAVPADDIPLTQELFAAARALVNEVDRSGTTLGAQTDAITRIRKAVGL